MPKIRISHFVTKGISINKENCSNIVTKESFPIHSSSSENPSEQRLPINSSNTQKHTEVRIKTGQENIPKSFRKRELFITSIESRYASTPVRQHLKTIKDEISQSATVFREIINKTRKTKKTFVYSVQIQFQKKNFHLTDSLDLPIQYQYKKKIIHLERK